MCVFFLDARKTESSYAESVTMPDIVLEIIKYHIGSNTKINVFPYRK